jgi:fermentation-respiration switch protein FrsA (DUF1100 family)
MSTTIKRIICISAIIFALGISAIAGEAAPAWPFANFFAYDADLPFNLEENIVKETGTYTLYHWTYDSTHDKRVTALFMMPKNAKTPVSAFLFMHGHGGGKDDAYKLIDRAAAAGYAGLFPDAEYHGERKVEGKGMYSKLPYSSRDAMIQTVIDYRRGVDLLQARADIDPDRIGFAGASMGGLIGPVIAAYEPRIRASVFAVGGADWGYLLKASVVAQALGLNVGDHPLKPAEFRRIVAPADPIHSAQLIAPRPVLMLNAKHDMLVNPFSNKLLFARLNPPKKIVWFDEGHGLPEDTALDYVLEFFDAYLRGNSDPAELGTQIAGHKTPPLKMDIGKPLPEIITEMPLADLFDYEDFLPLNAVKTQIESGRYSVSFLSTHDNIVNAELRPTTAEIGPHFPHVAVFIGNGAYERIDFKLQGQTSVLTIYPIRDWEIKKSQISPPKRPLSYKTRDSIIQNIFNVMRSADYLAQDPETSGSKPILIARGDFSHRIALIAAAQSGSFSKVILLPDDNGDSYENFRKSLIEAGRGDEAEKAFYWFEPSLFGKPACYAAAGVLNSFHCERVNSLSEALDK